MYHTVKTLSEESDQATFLQMTARTKEFSKYFVENCGNRYEQWAMCFRKGSGINTNMFSEASHRVLKHVYMHGRHNKRLNHLLQILLAYFRDKRFDYVAKVRRLCDD